MRWAAAATAVGAAVVAARGGAASWVDGDVGMDHMYGDLWSFTMATNTTAECYAACEAAASSGCVGWVMSPTGSCGANATCWLKSSWGNMTANPCRTSGVLAGAVLPTAFVSTRVGAVTPTGWLADELAVQAAGLAGYMYYFYPMIQSSIWIGGDSDTGLHEGGPYFLNGIVPLAYLTRDANVTAQMEVYINYILAAQAPSGWLGPDDMPTDGDEYWSRFNVIQSFLQYWEATGDARIMPALFAYLVEARTRMLAGPPLQDWAAARGQDFILSLLYLLDNWAAVSAQLPPNPAYTEAFLYDLAYTAHLQMLAAGIDWKTWFDTPIFPTGVTCDPEPCSLLTHGVNVAQAIKSEAVWYRVSADATDVASTYIRVAKLDTYHGAPSGVVQADEHLAGAMPSHGTELCGVVEAMYSYEVTGDILGDPFFFERAELIAYNALPATLTKDMWAHQYLQQANEVNAEQVDPHIWVTDGDQATIYGLAPNYYCCLVNFPQGWPKFVHRMIKASAAGGVAVAMWGPVTANVTLATGAAAAVSVVTDYPFGDAATVTVAAPAGTPIALRLPSWATAATVAVNGGAPVDVGAANGTFYSVPAAAGGVTVLQVAFNPAIRVVQRGNGSVSVYRGGLLYALQMGENFTTLATYAFQSADYAVTPTTPWNYALLLPDLASPSASLNFSQLARPSAQPYNASAPPVAITGWGRAVPTWVEASNAAAPPPASPACGTEPACGPLVPLTLVPFGSTHLRMSDIPYTPA